MLEKVDRTLETSRQAQEALNRDLDMKDLAFGIDQTCLVLLFKVGMKGRVKVQLQVTHNNSSEVALHSGIERVDQVRSQQRLRLIVQSSYLSNPVFSPFL